MVWQDYIQREIDKQTLSKRKPAITSRLDPQAQISITGGAKTGGGQTYQPVAAAPNNIFGFDPVANQQQQGDLARYEGVKTAFAGGANTQQAAGVGNLSAQQKTSDPFFSNTQGTAAAALRTGAGGRSRYSDEQIAFMTGGGGGGAGAVGSSTNTKPNTNPTPNTGGTTGDGGGDPPGPGAPVGPEAPSTGVEDNFGSYTEAEIDAALRGIEAEFGMTREQLLQDKSMIGAQYRLLMARMARAREQAIASTTSDAVSRGIYRSGILGENIGNVEQEYQEQSAGARQQQQIQEQTLERQLALLDQGQAARGAQVQNQILGQAAATMQQAGVGPAAAGFTGGVPTMTTAPTPVPQGNPYEGFPVVGGYYIDPNTGMAAARVDSV